MILDVITLLTEEEYIKYRAMIPDSEWLWWLKTPSPYYENGVRVVGYSGGYVGASDCADTNTGVRPFCVFKLEPNEPMFWHSAESLIGTKMQYGECIWTVLNAEPGVLYALCDDLLDMQRFDYESNVWETSELKAWLEAEGLKLIT